MNYESNAETGTKARNIMATRENSTDQSYTANSIRKPRWDAKVPAPLPTLNASVI